MHLRLPRPSKIESDMWVDEAIWGHRLYDEQTPWLCFMEFLGVVVSETAAGRGFVEDTPNSLAYTPKSRLHLRHILFNNPQISVIGNQYKNDPEAQWKKWLESMGDAAGIDNSDFAYLRERFESFEDLIAIVEFIRASTIEGENNKRWSSQFVFPYGPECLYEDLNVKENGGTTNDRRFFARTGELLYLMVCRSGKGEEILNHFKATILNSDDKFNGVVSCLQPKAGHIQEDKATRKGAYLPYQDLPDYCALAEDWLRIFRCKLSNFDVLPHLVTLAGLHMLLYSIKRSMEITQNESKPTFVLEIVAPKKTVIRDLSADSYNDNHSLSRKAVETYIRQITNTSEWTEAVMSSDLSRIKELFKEEFSWPKDTKDHEIENLTSPEAILAGLMEDAVRRHLQHVNKFHTVWSREIGLSSRRGSRRLRYAPHDSLLKTLVLCVVPERMEFKEFLANLYIKYGFIIGSRQATEIIASSRADQEDFDENAARLEQRLASMGLLRRLSDACAYVENPLTIRGNN